MESIGNSLQNDLMSRLTTATSGKKAVKDDAAQDGAVGNMLHSFGEVLSKQMTEINTLQGQADEAVNTYAVGGDIELHNVVIATEKAEMALQLASQVRNRVISAYQEISRMNV